MNRHLQVLRWATRAGAADHSAVFTWKTWLFGWFVRMLAQALFFTTAGDLLGPGQARYLLIGNSMVLVAVHGLFATASTTWELENGTLPLLVASPSSPSLVLVGRSLFWLPDGVVCGLGAVLLLSPVVGLHLTVASVAVAAGLIVLVALTTYCLGLFLGSLVLTTPDLRNVVSNAALAVMMMVCGPEVPRSAVGPFLGRVGECLPLTHGLLAIRQTLAGQAAGRTAVLAAQEAAVGACWLVAAVAVLAWRARRSRRDGAALFLT
ncbi:ABC transporter permease [Streptacidiphilus sp. PB12-B1b]|uniref:ABC transporter permease n=1 Tax=Streptacidiphilus sp. PB12-B1b TaxID=2705012 RepID=UPI0015F92652|nr:ABC transporter permease [Streptacidiphilus sp. PB12-B1b]QMU77884.1 ABC transporter permease [Streptacidiphilus sp. PB12-B1b]